MTTNSPTDFHLTHSGARLEAGPAVSGVDGLIGLLAARGVRRIFGVPGGECSLDVIAAANEAGIAFVLARSENAAAIMAAVDAELTGSLGVVMTTRGPGVSSVVNGIAYASLDRAPLLLIADGFETDDAFVSYQRFDQMALLQPLTKGALRLDDAAGLPALRALLDLALAAPQGPVYLEVTGSGLRRTTAPVRLEPVVAAPATPHSEEAVAAASGLIAAASRPVIIAGLEARDARSVTALRRLARDWQCTVFTTYKAKGVVPDDDPLVPGQYLGGPGEDAILRAADLIVFFGADPIEFPPKPWPYHAPILELSAHAYVRTYFVADCALVGDLAEAANAIAPAIGASAWLPATLADAKAAIRSGASMQSDSAISPSMLIDAVCAALSPEAVVTVDSGAHMLPAMALCTARQPRQVLISKGLATMAFALPAAIGAALADPARRVVALIGDGGLMMCAGELATAVQHRCNITVVVFNDSSLTLIGVKQRRRGFAPAAVDFPATDFSMVARGFGCASFRVEDAKELPSAIADALRVDGPSLVDVVVDPAAYHAQIRALRG